MRHCLRYWEIHRVDNIFSKFIDKLEAKTEKNKDKIAESLKIWYFNHREERLEKNREYNKVYDSQQCYDPKENDNCTLSALRARKRRHPDRYINIIPTDCIIKNNNIS